MESLRIRRPDGRGAQLDFSESQLEGTLFNGGVSLVGKTKWMAYTCMMWIYATDVL